MCDLDLVHLDTEAGRVYVLGKGKGERIPRTVNGPTLIALDRWLADRGPGPGPLFCRVDRAAGGRLLRLDGDALLDLVAKLGYKAGCGRKVRPHGLRHQGITRILELTKGNIDAAQKFARHASPVTTQKYNDNREDTAGEMARMLGDDA